MGTRTIGWKVPYAGNHPTIKRFFEITNGIKMGHGEIADKLGVSTSAVQGWKKDEYMPKLSTLKKMEAFIKEHENEVSIPGYTLESVVARKEKKDSPIYTFKAEPKLKSATDIGITDDELIEYAIKGMPEEMRVNLLKKFLSESGTRRRL